MKREAEMYCSNERGALVPRGERGYLYQHNEVLSSQEGGGEMRSNRRGVFVSRGERGCILKNK